MNEGQTKDPTMISGAQIARAIDHLKDYNMYGLADEVEQMQRQRATLHAEAKQLQQQQAKLHVELQQSSEPWCDEGYGQAKNGNCPHHNGDACLKMPQGLVEVLMRRSDINEIVEDATYRFMRHIQDQIEQEAGWIQFDYYRPEIDAYEYKLFVEVIGDPANHARWSDLLERSHKQETSND